MKAFYAPIINGEVDWAKEWQVTENDPIITTSPQVALWCEADGDESLADPDGTKSAAILAVFSDGPTTSSPDKHIDDH